MAFFWQAPNPAALTYWVTCGDMGSIGRIRAVFHTGRESGLLSGFRTRPEEQRHSRERGPPDCGDAASLHASQSQELVQLLFVSWLSLSHINVEQAQV